MRSSILVLLLMLWGGAPQALMAQFPGIPKRVTEVADKAQKYIDIRVTEEEEIRLGEEVSARVRARYGVAQDPKVHTYVGLVGNVLAKASSRGSLPFHFIVLDTDGVNAFAAPGGYIHITRGALALITDESQLAGVMAHEIGHVTQKHVIKAIQKGKVVQMGADQTSVSSNPEVFRRLVDACTNIVMAGFGRADELESDVEGVTLTAKAGYASNGLEGFLHTLRDRNSASEQKQGLFASHPEMDERLQKLASLISSRNLSGGVVLKDRYSGNVSYKPVELTSIAVIEAGTSGVAGGEAEAGKKEEKKEEKKKSRFSLARLSNPLGGGEESKQSAAVTGSGGTRGVDREREAKGGPNPALVAVNITQADIDKFRAEGGLK